MLFRSPENVARGGLIPREHHALEGTVGDDDPSNEEGLYKSSGPKLDIPEVNPNAKLATASGPGGAPQSGLGQIASAAGAAGTIANGIGDIIDFLPALFFSRGGLVSREHHAGKGTVGNMNTAAGLLPADMDTAAGLLPADMDTAAGLLPVDSSNADADEIGRAHV